jgi:hypothetical protein
MDDLTTKVLMGAFLLAVVIRTCQKGNLYPCFWTAAGGILLATISAFRHLQQSDIIVPLIVGVTAGIIGLVAHRIRAGRRRARASGT